jgi:hypothetical protein
VVNLDNVTMTYYLLCFVCFAITNFTIRKKTVLDGMYPGMLCYIRRMYFEMPLELCSMPHSTIYYNYIVAVYIGGGTLSYQRKPQCMHIFLGTQTYKLKW